MIARILFVVGAVLVAASVWTFGMALRMDVSGDPTSANAQRAPSIELFSQRQMVVEIASAAFIAGFVAMGAGAVRGGLDRAMRRPPRPAATTARP